jgi:HD-GYP domain-containing protein (c-di-GMP phosphodiesterase class II)
MDIASIAASAIKNLDALDEFYEALLDATPSIERDISRLKQTPDDREVVRSLFRTVHTIKGDAGTCRIDLGVAIVHPIETLLARLRNGEITFGGLLAETVLLAFDRLELAMENLRERRSLDNLRLDTIVLGLEKLAVTPPGGVDAAAAKLIEDVTDFPPATGLTTVDSGLEESPVERFSARIDEDLKFFRSLADQLESRSPLFKGRTQRLLTLAAETNQLRDLAVDPVQLEAAICMHDIGMMFLPESVWLKVDHMTPEERMCMRNHTAYAAGLLARMKGWEGAAEMVAQHHEMPDGRGYPKGLSAEAISGGAKILAIVDAFESVMLKHASRGRNRSVLRAIAEINACDNQFAPEWIGTFNQVIQRTISQ